MKTLIPSLVIFLVSPFSLASGPLDGFFGKYMLRTDVSSSVGSNINGTAYCPNTFTLGQDPQYPRSMITLERLTVLARFNLDASQGYSASLSPDQNRFHSDYKIETHNALGFKSYTFASATLTLSSDHQSLDFEHSESPTDDYKCFYHRSP